MKKLFTSWLVLMLAAISLSFLPTGVNAQTPFLDALVTPSAQTVAPGTSPVWTFTLTNNTTDTAYFILTGFNDGFPVTPDVSIPPYDPTPFGPNQTLAPNATLTLTNLFETDVTASAADAVYIATSSVTYDLYDDPTFTNFLVSGVTASADYQLTVQSPAAVPEPGMFGFAAASLLPLALYARKRFGTSSVQG